MRILSAGAPGTRGSACEGGERNRRRNPFHAGDDNVTKTYSSWTLAVAAAVGICALAGCNQRESAQETAKDVSEARQDANENVAEERREAADTAADSAEDRAA